MAKPTKNIGTEPREQGGASYPNSPDELPPTANDPGAAHRKGYSAEPGPERPVPEEGPVPLATDAETHDHVQKPDQSQAVQPSAPGEYTPNNRVMGADR
jgi:hypothetical protein